MARFPLRIVICTSRFDSSLTSPCEKERLIDSNSTDRLELNWSPARGSVLFKYIQPARRNYLESRTPRDIFMPDLSCISSKEIDTSVAPQPKKLLATTGKLFHPNLAQAPVILHDSGSLLGSHGLGALLGLTMISLHRCTPGHVIDYLFGEMSIFRYGGNLSWREFPHPNRYKFRKTKTTILFSMAL